MATPEVTQKVVETASGGFKWYHVVIAMITSGLAGGFFNPINKWLWGWFKKTLHLKDTKEKEEPSATVEVAKFIHEEKTETKLWDRIESLEKQFKVEFQGRVDCEKRQNELELSLAESKRERVFLLTEFISLKKAARKTELELIQVKDILKQHGWDGEIIPLIKDAGMAEDEKILNEITIGYANVKQTEGLASI